MNNININEAKKEVESMLNAGMVQLTPSELKKELDDLGYKISNVDSFNYFNNGNKNKYNARHVYIISKTDKNSFAHVNSDNKKNLPALQKIRYSCFVFEKNRIWEL